MNDGSFHILTVIIDEQIANKTAYQHIGDTPRNLMGAEKKIANNHHAMQHIFNDFYSDNGSLQR